MAPLPPPRLALAVGAVLGLTLTPPLGAPALLAGPPTAPEQPPSGSAPDTGTERGTETLPMLSLEELANVKVTSVARRPERRAEAAAPIYVITSEDIRRAGVTSLAEALRLAPGVQVSRINSNQWAVGVRGFASRLSRSLLVLVDGRSVYTPLFAGVYWEVQNLPLEDVERIEVIRGPGGTLWGANAVNGVINVITRRAADTQGLSAWLRLGSEDRLIATARYGAAAGEDVRYRVYAKLFDRDAQFHADGSDFDSWHEGRSGFRVDYDPSARTTFTLQGDAYGGAVGERVDSAAYEPPFARVIEADADVSGGNLLARWRHAYPRRGTLQVQGYYDRTSRQDPQLEEVRDTFNLDAQHELELGRHHLVSGADLRFTHGDTQGIETVEFVPADRTDGLAGLFLQDEIALAADRIRLALGTKVEHNAYSGLEVQPSASLLYLPAARHVLWASVARAVRTPSPVDTDIRLDVSLDPERPIFARLLGDPDFRAEEIVAWQAGYRLRPVHRVSLDVAAFHHRYDRLLSIEPGAPFAEEGRLVAPYVIANRLEGHARGVELTGDVAPRPGLRLSASYSYLRLSLHPEAGSLDTTSSAAAGDAPRHQGWVRAALDLAGGVSLDAFVRGVGELPSQGVPSYVTLDARAAWRVRRSFEVALVGQNLLEPRHLEFAGRSPARTEIQRAVYGRASVRW